MKKPVTICSNPNCESAIHKGQRVWHRGYDLYCHSKCLMTSFGVPYENPELLREKEIVAQQERIAMMREVFAKRQKKVVGK